MSCTLHDAQLPQSASASTTAPHSSAIGAAFPFGWAEVVAAIGALSIGDAFAVRLSALVVGGGVVVHAVLAGMQVAAAPAAVVSEADALSGRQRRLGVARRAVQIGRAHV